MFTLLVFKRDGDETPIETVSGFQNDIDAEKHFWEKSKPYLDDFASFIIMNELQNVPKWAIEVLYDNHPNDLGIMLNNGRFVNRAWLDNEDIWTTSANKADWYDWETQKTYTVHKRNVLPLSQEKWDNIPDDQKQQMLKIFKTVKL